MHAQCLVSNSQMSRHTLLYSSVHTHTHTWGETVPLSMWVWLNVHETFKSRPTSRKSAVKSHRPLTDSRTLPPLVYMKAESGRGGERPLCDTCWRHPVNHTSQVPPQGHAKVLDHWKALTSCFYVTVRITELTRLNWSVVDPVRRPNGKPFKGKDLFFLTGPRVPCSASVQPRTFDEYLLGWVWILWILLDKDSLCNLLLFRAN